MGATRPRADLKKRTVGKTDILGVTHQTLKAPGHEQRLNNLVEQGFSYPGLLKPYSVVCHEKDLITARMIPKEGGKKYYMVDANKRPNSDWMIGVDASISKSTLGGMREWTHAKQRKFVADEAAYQMAIPLTARMQEMVNAVMAERISKVQEAHPGKRIGVVVGEMHVDGVARLLEDTEARQELLERARGEHPELLEQLGADESSEVHADEVQTLLMDVVKLQQSIEEELRRRIAGGFKGKTDEEIKRLNMEMMHLADRHGAGTEILHSLSGFLLKGRRLKDIFKKDPGLMEHIKLLRGA